MPRATAKSPKTTVTEAVENALLNLESEKSADPKIIRKKEENSALLKGVSVLSVEKIIQDMAGLKLDLTKSLDALSEKLLSGYKQFSDLEKAVELEKQTIEEIYQIRAGAENLTALLEAQRLEKDRFELDMDEKRQFWKKEIEERDFQKKESETALKKERSREQEEYSYSLAQNRKKEEDAYETARAKKVAELVDREKQVSEKEALLADYQKRVETFEKEMAMAVKKAENDLKEKLENAYEHEKALSQIEITGERKLKEQLIQSLESKIKEQDKQIAELAIKAAEASTQMQAIAVKALESAQARVLIQKEEGQKN